MEQNLLEILDTTETKKEFLEILPVSVIDIEAQKERGKENHSKQSSRANYSPFPKEVSTLVCEFFFKNLQINKNNDALIFDPFAGWGDRAAACKKYYLNYLGFDSSYIAKQKALERFGVTTIIQENSETAKIPAFDGLFTCPPYWNLEKYDSETGLDRKKNWSDFLFSYNYILKRCFDAAKQEALFCIMVGEWRKNHVYYDLEYQTCKIFDSLGATVKDKIIISRKKVSKIKIMLPQCKRLGYSVRVHETLLIFKK